jgi:hypothetical protein
VFLWATSVYLWYALIVEQSSIMSEFEVTSDGSFLRCGICGYIPVALHYPEWYGSVRWHILDFSAIRRLSSWHFIKDMEYFLMFSTFTVIGKVPFFLYSVLKWYLSVSVPCFMLTRLACNHPSVKDVTWRQRTDESLSCLHLVVCCTRNVRYIKPLLSSSVWAGFLRAGKVN